MKIKILLGMIFSLTMMITFGCGGGGGAASTTVSGVAAKGPFVNGTVTIFAINETTGTKGDLLKTVTTDIVGAYSADLGGFTGPILVEVTGSYKDEATGQTVVLDSTKPLRAAISNAAGSVQVMVTPLTELAVKEAGTVLSRTNIDRANNGISTLFKVNIIATKPADAADPASATAPADQKNHGLVLAAISQLQKNTGKSLDDLLLEASADIDTSVTVPTMTEDSTVAFKAALFDFMASANNKTGVTDTATSPVNPTTVKIALLKISSSGVATGIGAIDFTATLPAGVTVAADATTKQAAEGAVVVSGVAATGTSISVATFDAAKLRVGVVNASGFGSGQFVTVACTIAAGSTVTDTVMKTNLQTAVSSATITSTSDLTGGPLAAGLSLSTTVDIF